MDSYMTFETQVKVVSNSMEFTHGIRRALMSALALVYFISLGFDVIWVTTLFAASTIIMTLFEFPTGAIADYDSRKKSLMISFLLFAVSFFGIFLFDSFWVLAAFWVLGDIAFTFSTGARSAWVVDALNATNNRPLLMRISTLEVLSERSGQILGGLIGLIVVAINFRFIWLVIALTNLLMFFVTWKYVEERNFVPEQAPAHYLKKVFLKACETLSYIFHTSNRQLRVLMAANLLGVASLSAFMVTVPLFLTSVLGLGAEYLSGIFAALAVVGMLAPYAAEKGTLRKGFRITLFLAWLALGVCMLAFGLTTSLAIALVVLALMHFAETVYAMVEGSAMEVEFSSKIRASLGSVNSINWAVANATAVFLAGLGITYLGIVPVLLICGGLAFITAVTYLLGMEAVRA